MHSKFTKSANKSKKKFLFKNSTWVSKNAEFHADFESVERVLKMCAIKKLLAKCDGKMPFFTLLMFVKLFLLITFFCEFFYNFLNGFEISVKFCISLYFFFTKKKFFGSYYHFCANFESERAKNGSKIKKRIL